MTPQEWAESLLQSLGLPVTTGRVTLLMSWAHMEQPITATAFDSASAKTHNPLNTKLQSFGGVPAYGGATEQYPSWQDGIAAEAQTIKQSNMRPIYDALKADSSLSDFTTAVESTPWASSAYQGRTFSQLNPPNPVGGGIGADGKPGNTGGNPAKQKLNIPNPLSAVEKLASDVDAPFRHWKLVLFVLALIIVLVFMFIRGVTTPEMRAAILEKAKPKEQAA